ncbi:N-6 DNA methylase [Actinospica sp. MGRD01-02]|uniref:site-specific DNA-methyltransferase (adenine-specific) n=1 Tax=Actinospica acidithermotolerans TaxID=2828514 RepID=A0A941E9Y3_9ACTN|nr:DNA methyltransferase [Actinospica acidithermotolerans]MBR7826623.1 N-6 DNA methylase [Actinospica acidithermotolerans]
MSATSRNQVSSAVHTVGGLLPNDMLTRIAEESVAGCEPATYHIIGTRTVRDEAERHWDYLKAIWRELREKLQPAPEAETPPDPTGTAVSDWIEPLFAELGYGRLTPLAATGIPADDGTKTFPVSHCWNHVPIHITAWNTTLDKRPGGPGTVPPQSLLQECLNRTDAHLWGMLTNGRQLRLLRDSNALASAAYVEFDLEAIFDGELLSEFVRLYRLAHVSRFEVPEKAAPAACWLEKWRLEAIETGTRALDHHRDGVQNAITTLGTGFLQHPANTALRRDLDVQKYHAALLRLAYRLIFLFVAEDRDALHPPNTPALARERYKVYFSTSRLRRLASRRRGTSHTDLYQTLRIVLDALSDEDGKPALGLPGLGGIFDNTEADAPLHGALISNAHLLEAVRHLSRVRDASSSRWRQVDYRNMGAEELGSIYESLLELVPQHSASDSTFELVDRLGNDRKKTGSYYTPASLIETLLDSTLDPVIDDAVKRGEQRASAEGKADASDAIIAELLSLTVCDPACGSGHFLVAAARRIAKRIAAVREANPEPTAESVRHALHEVVARCLYGVDLNPMAVDLAKMSLWIESLEPGKPLGFLDAHILHGNGLIGATPALLEAGIPDAAFKAIEGDDPKVAKTFAVQNEKERGKQESLFDIEVALTAANTAIAASARRITHAPADTLRDVRRQAAAYRELRRSPAYLRDCHIADVWCSAFVWRKTTDAPAPPTHDVFNALQKSPDIVTPDLVRDEVKRLHKQYQFFHWHLEFPEIFNVGEGTSSADPRTGWEGGFSCVVGNPPWDKVDFEDKKYFSVIEPSIASIAGTARRTRIQTWRTENPEAGNRYHEARRTVKGTFHFAGDSGSFPLCAKGLSVKGVNSLQTDQLFAERFATIAATDGRVGCIIPTAIATGAGAQYLFQDFTRRGAITSLYDFENRKPIFQGVDSRYKFCLLSLVGRALHEPKAQLAFFLMDTSDLRDSSRTFELSPDEIRLLNPNTGTLPIFRRRRDADLTLDIYRRLPVFWNEGERSGNPWGVTFKNLFNMTDDSDIFRSQHQLEAEGWERRGNVFLKDQERMLPLFEGKMLHHYDHRWNSFYGAADDDRVRRVPDAAKHDPAEAAIPRYWVADKGSVATRRRGAHTEIPGVELRLADLRWHHDWLLGWRDICRTTDERTAIPAFLPRTAVGHTFPLMLPRVSPFLISILIAAQSSLVFDFVSRQKISDAHMKLFVWKQLPVPDPNIMEPHRSFITPRVLELVYTAYDMAALARDLGDQGEPFCWDEDRRAQIRAELDAYFFHLYGISREDADYILETFQSDSGGGLKNNEINKYGKFRTKKLVLAEYNRMAPAKPGLESPLRDGDNYTSTLSPAPGFGPRHPACSAAA